MSFASYERLPALSNYMTAKLRLSVTQPFRKTSKSQVQFTRYPISSSRKDANFLMRRAGDEDSKPNFPHRRWEYRSAPNTGANDIELLLYYSPVITFHEPKEGQGLPEFTIFRGMYGRWSSADCAFFENILYRYFTSVSTVRGHLVMADYEGNKYVLQGEHLRFAYDEANRSIKPVSTDTMKTTTIRLNRKQTNIVRARYGEFYRYMKGMIGVRKQVHENKWYDWKANENVVTQDYRVYIKPDEWTEVIPTETVAEIGSHSHRHSQTSLVAEFYRDNSPLRKPPIQHGRHQLNPETREWVTVVSDAAYKDWLTVTEEFLALASAPSTDPDQHEKFHAAFVWLAYYSAQGGKGAYGLRVKDEFTLEPESFGKVMDEIIFKYHSEEVFERVQAKPNTVPSLRYESWVTRESA